MSIQSLKQQIYQEYGVPLSTMQLVMGGTILGEDEGEIVDDSIGAGGHIRVTTLSIWNGQTDKWERREVFLQHMKEIRAGMSDRVEEALEGLGGWPFDAEWQKTRWYPPSYYFIRELRVHPFARELRVLSLGGWLTAEILREYMSYPDPYGDYNRPSKIFRHVLAIQCGRNNVELLDIMMPLLQQEWKTYDQREFMHNMRQGLTFAKYELEHGLDDYNRYKQMLMSGQKLDYEQLCISGLTIPRFRDVLKPILQLAIEDDVRKEKPRYEQNWEKNWAVHLLQQWYPDEHFAEVSKKGGCSVM